MNIKFKKVLRYFSMIILIDLLYLNVFIPLTLSFEQVLLIAASVVKICDKKRNRCIDSFTRSIRRANNFKYNFGKASI